MTYVKKIEMDKILIRRQDGLHPVQKGHHVIVLYNQNPLVFHWFNFD